LYEVTGRKGEKARLGSTRCAHEELSAGVRGVLPTYFKVRREGSLNLPDWGKVE